MDSLSVNLSIKENVRNHSTATYNDVELRDDVKILIVGIPASGKTLLTALIKQKLKEIGVVEENIKIDSLDAPFIVQEKMINEMLSHDTVVDQIRKQKFSIYEVHQGFNLRVDNYPSKTKR